MLLMFYLLFTGPQGSEGCTLENHRQRTEITAYTGESVLLPCYCTDTNSTPETFTWEKDGKNGNSGTTITLSAEYKNRVQLFNSHSPGNLSLLISHLTEEDGGEYKCDAGGSGFTYIRLTVKGCALDNSETSIRARLGESVLLPCYCSELRAKPKRFTWKIIKSSSEMILIDIHQERDRVQLFNSHSPGNLSLLISHLTEEDGGWYSCEADGSGPKDISLTVEGIPPPTPSSTLDQIIPTSAAEPSSTVSSQKGSDSSVNYIYICAAVGASLLLMVLGGVFYWRYRAQRRGRTESQTGSRGGQETQDDALVLYTTVNKQDTHQEEQEQDDVTYSTVVHNKPSTSAHTLLDTGDTTEYACIKRS
ncbi:polymeric immunoglobulin receptor-like [Hoplias malabaricus]|uniref:polymeric immunoglobulin receptor-like n=1 Tax=Hoplias malabaricus TaxID=27720 RepID=UPI003462D50E